MILSYFLLILSEVSALTYEPTQILQRIYGEINENQNANQNEGIGYGTQIKPSGKIKFMSAYRFFRKEMVPIIKKQEQDLDGKGRHAVVHDLW